MTAARWLAQPEQGSIAPAIPIFALVLLMLGGLVIDASRQLNARGEAVAFAEEAARAGAQAVVTNENGEVQLVQSEVPELVGDYCARVSTSPAVSSCGLVRIEAATEGTRRPFTVVTEVKMDIPSSLLGMVGVRSLSVSGSGRSEPVRGDLDVVPDEPVP